MRRSAIFIFLLLASALCGTQLHAGISPYADTYYSAGGFDLDSDGQPDFIDTNRDATVDSLAVEWTVGSGHFWESYLGGMTGPMVYYPNAARILTDEGLDILIGPGGTFQWPQSGSALQFRSILYATTGANALQAWYTNAISAFTPQLLRLIEAEEHFRTAIRVNPYYKDALDGLLEVYYARAEGFMLIGNDYMAKAYKHKYERNPSESRSIVDLEVEDINSALICYGTGFREFMKLFNPEYIGVGQVRKPHLDASPDWLFFTRRFDNPNAGGLVSFEALRGQKNAVGVSSAAFNQSNEDVGTVQGSPTLEFEISDISTNRRSAAPQKADEQTTDKQTAVGPQTQYNSVDPPVKFTLPLVQGSPQWKPGTAFTLHFRMDATTDAPVKKLEMLIEFNHEKLIPPTNISQFDFSGSSFTARTQFFGPGQEYQGHRLYANQMLLVLEASSQISGNDHTVVKVPFTIRSGKSGKFYVYAGGSAGSLLSGFKDIGILYRLAAAYSYAVEAKVKRMYNKSDPAIAQNCLDFINAETSRIGTWFEHIQSLIADCASEAEIRNLDQLHTAINQVASQLSSLDAFKSFITSGSNVFGFPDDYVPFFNAADTDTFDAIKNLVIGNGSFTPQSATGFFGIARSAETNAKQTYGQLLNTKDRIRSELFTINEQAENRLVQVCGRIDTAGNPSLNVNDPIDYDLRASGNNLACEIGQNALLYERAKMNLDQTLAGIAQYLRDIELEKQSLQDAVAIKSQIPGIILQYGQLQARLDKEIAKIVAKQIKLSTASQALSAMSMSWSSVASVVKILANGIKQARLEKKKGSLAAEKTKLAAQERIRLTEIDTELFKLQKIKTIEQMLNDIAVKNISAQIAEIDIALALGQLNKFLLERDELLARRGRALANLGEMSFADPSFRLIQFGAMKEAEVQLQFLKRWLYLLTRAAYYKWSVQDNYVIRESGLPDVTINDVRRIQIVGALDQGTTGTPLQDALTAAQYAQAVVTFNGTGPMRSINSPVLINGGGHSDHTERFSIREDFLRIVRTEDTDAETQRVRETFKRWIASADRLDSQGNMVIEFDTMGHLEKYNIPATATSSNQGKWKNFALRSYSDLPLWNHKITKVGIALKARGLAFRPRVMNIKGSLKYGGVGYLKGDTASIDDFRAYSMRQWRDLGNGRLEPVDFRTVALKIPTSSDLESAEATYMVANLRERPGMVKIRLRVKAFLIPFLFRFFDNRI